MVCAALGAHSGCLGSVFFLDDWTQIVDCDCVDGGAWTAEPQRALTNLSYFLTYRLAGISAPAFHAGNLLLHIAVSLALLGFARDFLAMAARLPAERARAIGGWSAVLFAVHPLCSEMPNYARARDIGLVTLFALLAGWAALRWRRDGHWRFALGTVAAITAAAFSKEVGLPVSLAAAILCACGVSPVAPAHPGRVASFRSFLLPGVAVLVIALAGYFAGVPHTLNEGVRRTLAAPRLGWYVLTEARVFWMYLARVAWPAGLCSDHQIAWTRSTSDVTAWVATGAECVVIIAAIMAALWRKRPAVRAVGVLALIALFDIDHRLANVSSEFMVEYRMYPAMLTICILLAWLIAALVQRIAARAETSIFVVLIVSCVLTSARRTLDWRSTDALVANIVAQYPWQARAWQELQEFDVRTRAWPAVVTRGSDVANAFDAAIAFNRAQTLRHYDDEHLLLVRILADGNSAFALARMGRRTAAFEVIASMRANIEANHLTNPFFQSAYYYSSALVHSATGERKDALQDLRACVDVMQDDIGYFQRQLRRYRSGAELE